MGSRLDLSTMLAIHDALRRDLLQVARIAGRHDGTDGTRLLATAGWHQFKQFLLIHHQVEDEALWPALRATVADHPDQLALVDVLEQEHAVIDPLLQQADAVCADPDTGNRASGAALADVVDELVVALGGHLDHEEFDGLPLIEATLSLENWQRFGQLHGQRLIADAPTYMPWLLNGADPGAVAAFLANVPPPLAAAYRDRWAAEYAARPVWDAADGTARAGER